MMKIYSVGLFILFQISLIGCSEQKYDNISEKQLNNIYNYTMGNTLGAVFYAGRQKDKDVFYIRGNIDSSYVSISKNNNIVDTPFVFTVDHKNFLKLEVVNGKLKLVSNKSGKF